MQIYTCQSWSENNPIVLSEHESRHIASVIRHKRGDIIYLADGKGTLIEVEIIELKKNQVIAKWIKTLETSNSISKLHLAIAPTKNIDRIEWLIEKACEIGIGQFSFIDTNRTIRKRVNIERFDKIAQSACKQSKQLHFPQINEIMELGKWMKTLPTISEKYLTEIDCKHKIYKVNPNLETIFLIGPEGDFTPEEMVQIKQSGFNSISLGNSILRTETAGLLSVVQYNFLL